jgi:hypothetical protein
MRGIWSSGFFRLLSSLALFGVICTRCGARELELRNDKLLAEFGPRGLVVITDLKTGTVVHFAKDDFAVVVDRVSIDSARLRATIKKQNDGLVYHYEQVGYSFDVVYELRRGWRFLTKRVEIVESPTPAYTVIEMQPVRLSVRESIESDFTPGTYLPQFGPSTEAWTGEFVSGQYGTFLRLQHQRGLMLAVQNPFLAVLRNGQDTTIQYRPEMRWRKQWGPWSSDPAVIGPYQQTGDRIPARMVYEWKLPDGPIRRDGADKAEIEAFTECVGDFVLHPSPAPISVEIGWTLNDYQIDVATAEGRAEYKRIMDTASDLGIQNLLYAPSNHELALIENDADDWSWEHVLWLGLGQKIRNGQWDVEKSPVPDTVREMLDYAKTKRLGLLAYVYPSLPFAQSSSWIVNDPKRKTNSAYATLASREFQDFLIYELVAFKRRTGIAGYSFDYAFFNVPGSSAYSQWSGWRRVMEALRKADPNIVIDGRQTYQAYGPWSWLAGNYPHPTGNDEQAESFTPYPDLHFDRVSADRTRFVNYWYRNYEFAPHEVLPGYMTHQTPRNRNVVVTDGSDAKEVTQTVYTPFRRRDWDYLGYRYSVLSSIATGSWNNVVDMIPARDLAEFEHFSPADRSWIRNWIQWSVDQKDFLTHTKSILGQPAMGRVDGTAAIAGNRGYIFLFNPNYKGLQAEFTWDATVGLTPGAEFVLRELYPKDGQLIAKPNSGVWHFGDLLSLPMEGTSATVLELVPVSNFEEANLVFGVRSTDSKKTLRADLVDEILKIDHAAGQKGTDREVSILLQNGKHPKKVQINGRSLPFVQHGRYVSIPTKFSGSAFSHSQQVALHTEADGSYRGTISVPHRIREQLAKRRELWPIPWTKEDYETTWLAPDRLLLFVQIAEPSDTMVAKAEMDGSPLLLIAAYSSVRKHSPSFVGWYADLSAIDSDRPHSIRLTLPTLEPGRFQGLFFENVEDEYTDELAP